MMTLDHIVMGDPCQFWFRRGTGSMAPLLLDAAEAEEVLEIMFSCEILYDPESGEITAKRTES